MTGPFTVRWRRPFQVSLSVAAVRWLCSVSGLRNELVPGSHVDGFHIDHVRLHESTTSNGWSPGAAVPEAEQLKKRKYHRTQWPYSGLAD